MSIQDASGQTVLKIKGPCCTCDWCETEFQVTANFLSSFLSLPISPHSHTYFLLPPSLSLSQIMSADKTQEVGKISKQWSGLAKEYFTKADNFGIQCELSIRSI